MNVFIQCSLGRQIDTNRIFLYGIPPFIKTFRKTGSLQMRFYSSDSEYDSENDYMDDLKKDQLIEKYKKKYDSDREVLLKEFWKDFYSTIKKRGLDNNNYQTSEYSQKVFQILDKRRH